jgi:hypothetical protein
MRRAAVLIVALAATFAVACGDGETESASPTAPSGGSGSPGSCSIPSAPTNLAVAVVGTSDVVLTWNASPNASQYVVLAGSTPSSSNKLLTNAGNTRFPWSGMGPGTFYVRVQAMNSCGTSGSSNEVTFTIIG